MERLGRSRASVHRMLILSGHGSGAVGDFLPDNHSENGQHGSLTIPALEKALNEAQNIGVSMARLTRS